jgi:hypothetical protein
VKLTAPLFLAEIRVVRAWIDANGRNDLVGSDPSNIFSELLIAAMLAVRHLPWADHKIHQSELSIMYDVSSASNDIVQGAGRCCAWIVS